MEAGPFKVGAIIQARMGSIRLPNKVLRKLPSEGDRSILDQIIARVPHGLKVIVATSTNPLDDPLAEAYADHFRGSESNVLQRYYKCAKEHGFDQIVRLTADNPAIDSHIFQEVLNTHLNSDADYTYTSGLPLGTNFEMFSFTALENAYTLAESESDKEHVTKYFKSHPENFKITELKYDEYSDIRLTIDYESDFELLNTIYQKLGNSFTLQEVEELLDANPGLKSINSDNEQLS